MNNGFNVLLLKYKNERGKQMSLFKKMFASVGIGSAVVDTKLENDRVKAGDIVRGIVSIKGGNVDQQIEAIYLSLHTNYIKESNDHKHQVTATIDKFQLTNSFAIKANELKEIPFSFQLPFDIPISIGRTKIWVSTGLDIKNSVDPSDRDTITVLPHPIVDATLSTIADMGFRLREVDCEEASYKVRKRLPFVQEFEFVPVSGPFRGRLDELELIFFPISNDSVEVLVQVDRRARGLGGFLAEALEMDETNLRLTISASDLPNLKGKLQAIIQQYS